MKVSRILIAVGLFSGLTLILVQIFTTDLPWLTIAVASGVVILLSSYLGLDLTAALSRSFELPKGQAEKINVFKYIYSLFVVILMLGSVLLVSWLRGISNDEALAILAAGFYAILAVWIASRKLSKIAENKGGPNE